MRSTVVSLSGARRAKLRQNIEDLTLELQAFIAGSTDAARPVELDQPFTYTLLTEEDFAWSHPPDRPARGLRDPNVGPGSGLIG